MQEIILTPAQIDDLVQRLKGSDAAPSEMYAEALLEAGILPPGASLDVISSNSLAQLEDALMRCDKCLTYQPAEVMEQTQSLALCPECVANLTYGQVAGG